MRYKRILLAKTLIQLVRMHLQLARISFQFARTAFQLAYIDSSHENAHFQLPLATYLRCCEIYDINSSSIWHMRGSSCILLAKTSIQLVRMHLQLARISFQFARTAFQLEHLKNLIKIPVSICRWPF
jgi:hypothetical protein